MSRSLGLRTLLGALLVALLAAPVALAQNRVFTGPPGFTVTPRVVDAGTGAARGPLTTVDRATGPQLVTIPGGFKHSNRNLEYTVRAADVNTNLALVWTIRRPFTRPVAGAAGIREILSGYVHLPNGTTVTRMTQTTREVGVAASALTINVNVGGFAAGNNPFNEDQQTAPYAGPAGAGILEQTFRMELRPTQVGLVSLGLPDSAESMFDDGCYPSDCDDGDPCTEDACSADGLSCESVEVCGRTCSDACGGQSPAGCYCDSVCPDYGDCCPDVCALCGVCSVTVESEPEVCDPQLCDDGDPCTLDMCSANSTACESIYVCN